MSLIVWLAFGLIIGLIANWLDPRPQEGGIIGAIVLGILGSMLGGLLANIVLGIDVTGFNLSSITIAVLGSLLLLFVGRALRNINS